MKEKLNPERSPSRSLRLLSVLVLALALAAQASATKIWGRIVGLGSVSSSNYIQSVKITTDKNEVFEGRATFLQGPGLIWEAQVPNKNRAYKVEVKVTPYAASVVRWNPEYSWGSWTWWDISSQCNDVRFWLR